ncbi:MAG: acyl-CoA dehydrogenase family protein [Pseudomonadota bacterium]
MEFGLSEEQTLLQDSVRRFLSDNTPLDAVRKVAAGETDDKAIWQGLVDLGIPGLLIPEDKGGVGLGSLDAAVVAECLGYSIAPTPFLSSGVLAAVALNAAGGQDELLGKIATGQGRVGIAFSEAIGARADAGVTVTENKITGKSIFALDSNADTFLVATRDHHLYLVDRSAITITPISQVDKTRTTCELVYKGAPATLVTDDAAVLQRALDVGRVMMAADTLGAAQNMLDQAVAYAKTREQFNRPIGSFQAVKHMCAEMAAGLEPCRSMVWYAGHALDEIPEEAQLNACHTKAHLSEVGKFVAKTATEVHGGMGFTDLVGLHYWFKRIGFNRQILGTPELLREEAARVQGLAA